MDKGRRRLSAYYLVLFAFASEQPRVHLIQQSKSDFDTQSRYEGSREVALILPPSLTGQSFLADFLALPMLPRRISVKLISRGWI